MQTHSKLELYDTDLTDAQWQHLRPLLPKPFVLGRPRENDRRTLVNGIFYTLRSGCAWRLLPKVYGAWQSVYGFFRTLTREKVWDHAHDHLRERVRQRCGKKKTPTAAILDSQTVKTGDQACASGYDAGKKIEGRKRHVLVDTLGLLLAVMVTPASVQDRDGAQSLLAKVIGWFSRLQVIWADAGYAGQLVAWVKALRPFGKLRLEIVPRLLGTKGFKVLPHRWIVERTLAWLVKYRRLARDYEQRPDHSEALIQVAMIHLMLKRLGKSKKK